MLDLTSEVTSSVKKLATVLHPYSSFWLVFSELLLGLLPPAAVLGPEEAFQEFFVVKLEEVRKSLRVFCTGVRMKGRSLEVYRTKQRINGSHQKSNIIGTE